MNVLDANLAPQGVFDALGSRPSLDALGDDRDLLKPRWLSQGAILTHALGGTLTSAQDVCDGSSYKEA